MSGSVKTTAHTSLLHHIHHRTLPHNTPIIDQIPSMQMTMAHSQTLENHRTIMSSVQSGNHLQNESASQISRSSNVTISFEDTRLLSSKENQQGIIEFNKDEVKGSSDDCSSASSTRTPPTTASQSIEASSFPKANDINKMVPVVTPQESTSSQHHFERRSCNYQVTGDVAISADTISTPILAQSSQFSAAANNIMLVPERGSAESSAITETMNSESSLQSSIPAKTSGCKRKISALTSPGSVPSNGTNNNTLLSRRDSLPMGLRNKKMKATDCLLFAASLLEQDVAEALVGVASPPTNEISGSLPTIPAIKTDSVTIPVHAQPKRRKTKPMKKMLCEKVERSMKEAAAAAAAEAARMAAQENTDQSQQKGEGDGDDIENKPKDADVLCGRGGKVNKHPGNVVYRKVVEYNKSYYQSVHKKHRILVSQSIVKAILNYGGRFMGQQGKEWSPICFKRAVQKTSQALRERSNTSEALQGVDPNAKQLVEKN